MIVKKEEKAFLILKKDLRILLKILIILKLKIIRIIYLQKKWNLEIQLVLKIIILLLLIK